jgi:hypothetical protein
MDFDRRLAGAQSAAEAMAGTLDPSALVRLKSPEDPALADFVGVLATVWRSLTDRPPSTRKKAAGEASDFVLFVHEAVRLVEGKCAAPSASRGHKIELPNTEAIYRALTSTRIPSRK